MYYKQKKKLIFALFKRLKGLLFTLYFLSLSMTFFSDSAKQKDETTDVFSKLISKSLEKLQETENQKEQKTVKYCSVLIKDVRKHPWWGPKVRQLSGDRPVGTGVGAGGSTTAPSDSGINRSKLCSSEPSTSTKVRKVWQINIAGVKVYNFLALLW